MNGIYFSFENADIQLTSKGTFDTAQVDSQTCALISLSQVCRLSVPELGVQLGALIENRKRKSVNGLLAKARRQVLADGALSAIVEFNESGDLHFEAVYP